MSIFSIRARPREPSLLRLSYRRRSITKALVSAVTCTTISQSVHARWYSPTSWMGHLNPSVEQPFATFKSHPEPTQQKHGRSPSDHRGKPNVWACYAQSLFTWTTTPFAGQHVPPRPLRARSLVFHSLKSCRPVGHRPVEMHTMLHCNHWKI